MNRRIHPVSSRPMPKGAARRLDLDASRHELESAKTEAAHARVELRVAQADLLRVEADRAAGRAPAGAVSAARGRVQTARNDVRATAAAVRAQRAAVNAARATIPGPTAERDAYPLGRLMAAHDALTARWMSYETDAAKVIAYPTMSDSHSPLLTAFLDEERQARWLRPRSVDARVSPAEFAAYRTAVRRATQAFDAAERDALRRAGHRLPPPPPGVPESWIDIAQDVLLLTQGAVDWSIRTFQRRTDPNGSEPPKR